MCGGGGAKSLFPTHSEWVAGSAAMLPAQTPAGIWITLRALVLRSRRSTTRPAFITFKLAATFSGAAR